MESMTGEVGRAVNKDFRSAVVRRRGVWRRERIVGREETRLAEEAVEHTDWAAMDSWDRRRLEGSQSVIGELQPPHQGLGRVVARNRRRSRVGLVPCTCGCCCLVRNKGIVYLPDFQDLSSSRIGSIGLDLEMAVSYISSESGRADDDSVLATCACP
jgi:hypothetical protein